MSKVNNREMISACITTIVEMDMHLKAAEQCRNQLVALLHENWLGTANDETVAKPKAQVLRLKVTRQVS